MRYNPDIHHRHSIRIKDYDYSSNGLYFITICTQDRAMLFGEVVGADLVSAQMCLNNEGKMIKSVYLKIIESYDNITSDEFIIMPNHFHCIIDIFNNRADTRSAPTNSTPKIGRIIQEFKSRTTVEYINGVKSGLYPSFNKRIWQRNYYERIIRNDTEYQMIRRYIVENPSRWTADCYFDT